MPGQSAKECQMTALGGKNILVTGATTGIGLALTRLALETGANVLVVAHRPQALEELVGELGCRQLVGTVADIAEAEQVEAAVALAVESFGSLDGAFSNAGLVGNFSALHDYPESEFDRIIKTNIYGSFHVLKFTMRAIRSHGRGGSIVSTSSTCGYRGMASIGAYVASKHAIEGMTRCAALEGAPVKIRVNCIAPGFTDTPMMALTHNALDPDDPARAMKSIADQIPMQRYAHPKEIALAASWLLSDESSYVTGQVYGVDGGGSTGF
jgi:NAD(P)-dependent dehydrogenase (short-subunit alcohol dehydrogenase family)